MPPKMKGERTDSLIRWTAQDRRKLDTAINKFNKEVNKLSKMDIDVPEKKSFTYMIQHITTRKELENVLDSMNKFNEKTATTEVKLSSGEVVSEYEYQDITSRKQQAEKNLYEEMQDIQNERMITQNKYMGQERITEIEETLEAISDYTKNAEEFRKTAKRIQNIGRTDYMFARQKLFRENFMKSLENVQNFDHYKNLKEVLNKYRNPAKFYDYVKKSNILMDIFIWYNADDGYATYGKFKNNDEMFDYALENELGLKFE